MSVALPTTAESASGPHQECVGCASVSPNGADLASGSWDKANRIWKTESWTIFGGRLEGYENLVTDISFSPDGERIVSSSHDGTITTLGD